jgi:hypothetical protein
MKNIEFKVNVHCSACPDKIDGIMQTLDDKYNFSDGFNVELPSVKVGDAVITFDIVDVENEEDLLTEIEDKFSHQEWKFKSLNPEGIKVTSDELQPRM